MGKAPGCPALDLAYPPGPDVGALHDRLYAALDEFEPAAICEHETGDGWRVFFRTRARRDEAAAELARLCGTDLLSVTGIEVPDEGWAHRSQAGLGAVRVGRLVVAPPWDESAHAPAVAGDIVILIQPSMGFGTGHHETTRLCLALLQARNLAGRRVIDVGTGSGVLAIAAARLNAASVVGIDRDPDALASALENVVRNGVASAVTLRLTDVSESTEEPAGVVVANLTAAAIERHAEVLAALVEREGDLILSGFAPDDLCRIELSVGARAAECRQDGDWIAARFTLPTES
ncbi:MAG TPA: 50S ribosomal protein L11 methyltransferase [Vicinamibacterales bacterium]|nr:50S ribosomal protein L11 methyltransferase [Vicinamibacterales bacterium]